MLEELRKELDRKDYREIGINAEGIYLYFIETENIVYVLNLVKEEKGKEIQGTLYDHIMEQMKRKFINNGCTEVKFLNVLFTNNLEKGMKFCKNHQPYWMVDELSKRLIVYDNQYSDFLDLRKTIEKVLSRTFEKDNEPFVTKEYEKRSIKDYIGSISSINTILIAINILVFVILELIDSTENAEHILKYGGMFWPKVVEDGEYYRLFTHMFLHFGIVHLSNNMLVLAIIGNKVEKVIGKVSYLVVYLGTGLIAGIASMGYNIIKGEIVISAGASGAVFGVVGTLFALVMLNKGKIDGLGARQMAVMAAISLYGGFVSQGVDNVAHVVGFLVGILFACIIHIKHRREVNS